MPDFAEPLARLIAEVKRLPGIGQKSAQRIAFHLLRTSKEDVDRLVLALTDVKEKLGLCTICGNISDGELCPYCRDPHRDRSKICVCRRSAEYSANRDDAHLRRAVSRAAWLHQPAARHWARAVAYQGIAEPAYTTTACRRSSSLQIRRSREKPPRSISPGC